MKYRKALIFLALMSIPAIAQSEEQQIIDNIEFLEAMDLLEDENWDAVNEENSDTHAMEK